MLIVASASVAMQDALMFGNALQLRATSFIANNAFLHLHSLKPPRLLSPFPHQAQPMLNLLQPLLPLLRV